MSSAPRRRTYGKSPICAWIKVYLASTRGRGKGSSRATKMSSRDECDEDGWVPTGGVAPLSWRFLVDSLSASARYVILSLLVWQKSTVGHTVVFISPFDTSCIISSSLMCPARSGMLDKLEGDVSSNLTYS